MSTDKTGSSGTRLGRLALIGAAAALVLAPIGVGLVLAWQAHPVLVVPAYLVGIPLWLTLLSGAWSLVSRVRRTPEESIADPLPQPRSELPVVRTELRLPPSRAARTEVRAIPAGAPPRGVRTPTP